MEVFLLQAEADALIRMEKVREDDTEWDAPGAGDKVTIPLTSADKREKFLLDMSRGRIDLLRGKYQNRGRQVVPLVRLEFGGAMHVNPDGQEIPCPHLHIYREGYGDKWAIPVPADRFPDTSDPWRMYDDFLRFCNITRPPVMRRGLFT